MEKRERWCSLAAAKPDEQQSLFSHTERTSTGGVDSTMRTNHSRSVLADREKAPGVGP